MTCTGTWLEETLLQTVKILLFYVSFLVKCQDIAMTINAFYFKIDDKTYTSFKHEGKSNITYDMATIVSEDEIDWDNLHVRKISQFVRLFTSFRIYCLDMVYILIGHGKFISIFSIEQWRWDKHIHCANGEVMAICRRGLDYDAILSNGDIVKIDINEGTISDYWKIYNGTPERII